MPAVLKFLRLSSGSTAEKDLEIIDKASQYAQSNEISIEVIRSPDEIRELLTGETTDKNSIYICFPFEGKIFEALKGKGYRIIGPQCVISCLLLEISVPKQTYPVCNVAMLGVVACCSSMKKEDRNKLHHLVEMMGGETTCDFTSEVTHLIAKEVGSKKYKVACTYKVPILLPQWVESCWTKSKYDHICGTDPTVTNEFNLPILQGCTVCVTGIDLKTRENIKSLVQNNGGVYSGELDMKTCTHLLVEHPKGQKYMYAKQWKIHCVLPSWLHDCLKKGYWLEESKYNVEVDTDVTMNQTAYQRNEIQDTFRESNKSKTSLAAEIAARSVETSKSSTSTILTNQSACVKVKTFDSKSIKPEPFQCSDISSTYLDGLCIYLCNKPGHVLNYCRKVINSGGGTRLGILSDQVTHIVIWDQVPTEVYNYINFPERTLPQIVSPMWLIDSFKAGEVKNEKVYSLLDSHNVGEFDCNVDEVFAKPNAVPQASKTAIASSLHINFEDDIADETTLMNQYLTSNHESTRLSEFDVSKRKSSSDNDQTNKETIVDDETTTMEELLPAVLKDKLFVVERFDTEQTSRVKNLIQEYSGEVVSHVSNCDYIVVPPSYNRKLRINKKEVTLCWLEQSLELEELQNPKSSFLFRPILISEKSKPLEGCVITISQYTGVERQHLLHLAELLGAVGQEFFVRHDTQAMKASTHLILLKPEGSKYNASIKWKIPCVSKQWLFKCAKKGKKLNEIDFPVTEDETVIEEENASTLPNQSTMHSSNDGAEVISFDLSTHGASIMEKPMIKQDSIKKNDILNKQTELKNVSENNTETDFSNFNRSISEEKVDKSKGEDTLNSLNTNHNQLSSANNAGESSSSNKENICSSVPAKPTFELNKSRYSFDFTDALDMIQSPATFSQDSARRKSRKSRGSLPFDVQFSEALQRAVDKHVPETDRIKHQESEEHEKIDTKEFLSTKTQGSGILKDVIAVVSKKLAHRQMELHQIVNIMGGDTRFMYDSSCTHFVHQGHLNDKTRDYSEAKKDKKFLVSPHWLEACLENNCRVEENNYPVTYNPRMSIEISSNRPTRNKTSPNVSSATEEVKKSEFKPSSPKPMATATSDVSVIQHQTDCDVTPSTIEENLDMQKKMEQIMEATKAPRPRKSRRQTTSMKNDCSSSANNTGSRKLRSRTSSQNSRDSSRSSNSDPLIVKNTVIEQASEQSQGDYITYDDPTGRRERERILAQLKRASPSQDIESFHYPLNNLIQSNDLDIVKEDEEVEKQVDAVNEKLSSPQRISIALPITNESPKPQPVDLLYDEQSANQQKKGESLKKFKFILSGMTGQEKIDYGAIIEKLGGELFEFSYFSTECTHVVLSTPSRSEKYLATIACGKWALHKSFLEASREADGFVNEIDHEWGSQPGATTFVAAARRWRMNLTEKRRKDPSVGAFTGWSVLLCIEPAKLPGFKRILEAGGATVAALRPPFTNLEGITHAFIGDKKLSVKTKLDYEQLNNAGIWILKPDYISDFLTEHPKPPAFNYIIDEVKTLNDQNVSVQTPGKRKASNNSLTKPKRTRR